jgi:hypothetical protein
MRFSSEQERIEHPQARLIPLDSWDDIFNKKLSEFQLELMQVPLDNLGGYLDNLDDKGPQSRDAREEQADWISLAYAHPDASDDLLMRFTEYLQLPPEKILQCALILGQESYLEKVIQKHDANLKILIMEGDDSDGYYKIFRDAARNGRLDIMEKLMQLVPECVPDMICAGQYDAFQQASTNGHLDVMERLIELVPEMVHDMISGAYGVKKHKAFIGAAKNGHLDVMERFIELAPEDLPKMISAGESSWDGTAFQKAAESGHLHIIDRLVNLAPDSVQKMIASGVMHQKYAAFLLAATNGHLQIMERLIELAPDNAQAMISENIYDAFQNAAANGHWDSMERLMQLAPNNTQNMISANYYEAFAYAATSGHLHVMERLIELAPDKVQNMISGGSCGVRRHKAFIGADRRHKAFIGAAKNGHLHVMERLIELSPESLPEMISSGEGGRHGTAFQNAAGSSHLHIMERLIELAPDNVQDMIEADNYSAFRHAAAKGRLDIIERLMALAPSHVQAMIKADNYDAFRSASKNGRLHIMERLIELAPDKVQAMIQAGNYDAFQRASQNGHLHIMKRLMELAPGRELDMILAADFRCAVIYGNNLQVVEFLLDNLAALAPGKILNMVDSSGYSDLFMSSSVIEDAVTHGHFKAAEYVIKKLIMLSPANSLDILKKQLDGIFRRATYDGQLQIIEYLMSYSSDYAQYILTEKQSVVFMAAAIHGHWHIMRRLMDLASDDVQAIMSASEYGTFQLAAANGHWHFMKKLIDLAPDNVKDMVSASEYGAFRMAVKDGHLHIMDRLIELAPEKTQDMVEARNYDAFRNAARYGHLDIMKMLIELAPEKTQDMFEASGYDAFRGAVEHGLPDDIIRQFLLCPAVFSWAEDCETYGESYIYPLIRERMHSLREAHEAFGGNSLSAVFDINNTEEAKIYLCILRHLIRRNDPALLDDIRLLAEVPSVTALLRTEVRLNKTPEGWGNDKIIKPSELITLALKSGNQEAAIALINSSNVVKFHEDDHQGYSYVKLKPASARALIELLNANTTLEKLDLSGSKLDSENSLVLVEALRTNARLQELDLRGSDLKPECIPGLVNIIKSNTGIRALSLSDNRLGPEGSLAVAEALKTNTALQILEFSGNKLTTQGAMVIAETLKTNPALQSIDLSSNNIGTEGALALAGSIKPNAALQTLNLASNNIDSQGALAIFKVLKTNTSIQVLNLGYNRLGPDTALAFSEMLRVNLTIKHINFHQNNLGPEGTLVVANALKSNYSLLRLDGVGNEEITRYLERNNAIHRCLSPIFTLSDQGELNFDGLEECIKKFTELSPELMNEESPLEDTHYLAESYRLLAALSHIKYANPDEAIQYLAVPFENKQLQILADKAFTDALQNTATLDEAGPGARKARSEWLAYQYRNQPENPFYKLAIYGLKHPEEKVTLDKLYVEPQTDESLLLAYQTLQDIAQEAVQSLDDKNTPEAILLLECLKHKSYNHSIIRSLFKSPAFAEALHVHYPEYQQFDCLETMLFFKGLKESHTIPDDLNDMPSIEEGDITSVKATHQDLAEHAEQKGLEAKINKVKITISRFIDGSYKELDIDIYTHLLSNLAENIEVGSRPRWTSGGSGSQKVHALNALKTFINNQDENWMSDPENQIKLLTLIKSVCSTHRNWAPIHFGPPASLDEFLTEIQDSPDRYGTTVEIVNALETSALSSRQLREAISTGDFSDILNGMPIDNSLGNEHR